MSDSSDIVIDVDTESGVDVDTESGDCTGGEQDDNENNKEQEDNYQADDEEQGDDCQRDDNQGDAQQCNNETTCTDNPGDDNDNVNEATAAPENNKVNHSNVKNDKKKWEKNKNNKAPGKGGGNNGQNVNTNANNKNTGNNNQSKNTQQNNNNNQGKGNPQNKPNHQQNSNDNNKNYNNNNTKNDNPNSEKSNQDNKIKSQYSDNQGNKNNQGNQNKPNHNNNNNQSKPNHNSSNNQNNNNYNKNNNSNNNSSSNHNSNNNNSNNSNANKDNSNKGAPGVGGMDILRTIRGLIHYPKKYEKPWPLDSFVLRLHYRMGVAIFILGFMSIKGNWHNYSHTSKCAFNADSNPPAIYENICLSYPYVEETSGEGPALETTRRYLLFYRWVYWSFLILAGLFYMPRLFSKQMDNPRLRKLLEELSSQESRYDSNGWEKNCETILSYLHRHQGTHLGLYFNLILCHLLALVIDIGTILFFNFILDGRFLYLLYHVWPLNRDPENFQDPLSSAFPPFAKCELSGSVVLIMAGRTEQCYVHLTLMELYEKVFLMLWIWLGVMVILAAFQILALFIMFLPFTHGLLLKTSSSNKSIRKMKKVVMKTYGLGDIYALFVIKKRISDAEFRFLLSKLTKIEEEKKEEKVESNDKLKIKDGTDQNGGNYHRNINTRWLVDEFPPNAPTYPDVTYPPDLSLGDYFPEEYLRQRRAVSTPKPPSTQPVVPAFPIPDPQMGQPKYGWNSALYRQACNDQIKEMNSKKDLPSHAV